MISQVLRHKTKEWVIINPFCTTQSPTKTKEWVIINPFCKNIEFEQMILKVFIFCITFIDKYKVQCHCTHYGVDLLHNCNQVEAVIPLTGLKEDKSILF
jgi:hypothetical protein